jgi:hypothetical protein
VNVPFEVEYVDLEILGRLPGRFLQVRPFAVGDLLVAHEGETVRLAMTARFDVCQQLVLDIGVIMWPVGEIRGHDPVLSVLHAHRICALVRPTQRVGRIKASVTFGGEQMTGQAFGQRLAVGPKQQSVICLVGAERWHSDIQSGCDRSRRRAVRLLLRSRYVWCYRSNRIVQMHLDGNPDWWAEPPVGVSSHHKTKRYSRDRTTVGIAIPVCVSFAASPGSAVSARRRGRLENSEPTPCTWHRGRCSWRPRP